MSIYREISTGNVSAQTSSHSYVQLAQEDGVELPSLWTWDEEQRSKELVRNELMYIFEEEEDQTHKDIYNGRRK